MPDFTSSVFKSLACYPPKNGTAYEMVYYYENGSTAYTGKNYIHGGSFNNTDCANVGSGLLTGNNQEYNVHLELDFLTRTISFTVTSKDNPSITATVSDIAMSPSVSYTDCGRNRVFTCIR